MTGLTRASLRRCLEEKGGLLFRIHELEIALARATVGITS
jgi:hypothetical protein